MHDRIRLSAVVLLWAACLLAVTVRNSVAQSTPTLRYPKSIAKQSHVSVASADAAQHSDAAQHPDDSPETTSSSSVSTEADDDELDKLLDLDISELGSVPVMAAGLSLDATELVDPGLQAAADAPAADIIRGKEATNRNTTDAGNLLRESMTSYGVYVQQRSPIIGDPRIRGYRFGQYLARADGAYWYPARLDLDSIISKIDSKFIDDVVVLNGPYSVRYGPGFSFIDIQTRSTPRSKGGVVSEATAGLSYNINGGQWNGNNFYQCGTDDWGALIYYSHLTGSDYADGSGRRVPSSYKSRNVNVALGRDLLDNTSLEFRYLRQDQTDVELAGQFTDIDFLSADGFTVNLRSEDAAWADWLSIDAWYNQTRAAGSGGRPAKQELFNSVFDLPSPRGGLTLPRDGVTDFFVSSTGFASAVAWGIPDDVQLMLGTDFRRFTRYLNEVQIRPDGSGGFQSGTENVLALVPQSESDNPGIFSDITLAVNDRLTIKGGARVDWVSVNAGPGLIERRGGSRTLDVLGPDRANDYTLWGAYITGEYAATDAITTVLGFGVAQRPPTLTELYAMRPFESVLQQGLNRIQGFPNLRPERLNQFDVGVNIREGGFSGSVRGFYALVEDYITSQGLVVDPTSGTDRITSVFVNTPEATLAGCEVFGQRELTPTAELFGSLMYVQGKNRTLNEQLYGTPSLPAPAGARNGALVGRNRFDQTVGAEPLPQIPPLESRLGVRFHERQVRPRWEIELSARIVDDQDRIANRSLLEQPTPGFTTYDVRWYWRPANHIEVIGGILNFTDKLYREHLDNRAGNQLYQPGISGYVGYELTY